MATMPTLTNNRACEGIEVADFVQVNESQMHQDDYSQSRQVEDVNSKHCHGSMVVFSAQTNLYEEIFKSCATPATNPTAAANESYNSQ